ncbi:MAG: hypothetical protein F4Z14_04165 [Gammaproteobacteria bacterium]|nr:hypothetical protein [Gammaproteobacteria bacterium]
MNQRPLEFAEHLQSFVKGRMISFDILSNPDVVFEQDWFTVIDSEEFSSQTSKIQHLVTSMNEQKHPNEQQTKQDLIFPMLSLLEWPEFLVEQKLSLGRQKIVPDLLLFSGQKEKYEASKIHVEAHRYGQGICIGELKRWGTNLDRHSGSVASPTSQMLHYLRRNQDINEGRGAQWGLLTDGRKWRIYYARAQSVTEEFLEIDLGALYDSSEQDCSVFEAVDSKIVRKHVLALFVFFFANRAFSNEPQSSRHLRAIASGRHYESRVTTAMGEVIFNEIYPKIAQEIARQEPVATPDQIRDEALMFLFRLLFVLYAEDRGLLPIQNKSYRFHRCFRYKVREQIGDYRQFSIDPIRSSTEFWNRCLQLWSDISQGNSDFGLPAYNGDLFDLSKTPLLNRISFDDVVMMEIVEPLSYQQGQYVNYRTLNVQHLGAIYERLLARRIVLDDGKLVVVSDPSSRKETGSYYTPDYIVRLTIEKALGPLVEEIYKNFDSQLNKVELGEGTEIKKEIDPAQCILDLRICDPAMGSAHFLVDAVDWLSDRLLEALAHCTAEIPGYVSPVFKRITEIRERILEGAQAEGWEIVEEQLDDRQIVKRLVLKKCIYGVDLNPMAVELAKLSLWLHTFTVGAPLSFLNHHLRCGNSIFGSWIGEVTAQFEDDLFQLNLSKVLRATAVNMQEIEELPDTNLDEVRQSEGLYQQLNDSVSLVKNFLDVHLGLAWLRPTKHKNVHDLDLPWLSKHTDKLAFKKEQEDYDAQVAAWCEGQYGDPLNEIPDDPHFLHLWNQAQSIAIENCFLHWEAAFPGVWNHERNGFDAIVGNPPWERIKFEEAEWIAYRKPALAKNMTQDERDKEFHNLLRSGDPLIQEFYETKTKAEHTMAMVRQSGHYPWFSLGDINIYGLFAERALTLLNRQGNTGLVLMAGIAADRFSAPFFQRVTRQGRLRNFYHFENRRVAAGRHFPDVHAQLKFCVFVASAEPNGDQTHYGCFVDDVKNVENENVCFNVSTSFFDKVNPNTGTLPILHTREDRDILSKIYDTSPIMRRHDQESPLFSVRFCRMFDMTNDRKSGKMRTHNQLLEEEQIWELEHNVYEGANGRWLPLYEGKMIWQFDHRSADVKFNPSAPLKRASPAYLSDEAHQDPSRCATPQFWVSENEVNNRIRAVAQRVVRENVHRSEADLHVYMKTPFFLGFRDITNTTDRRTMISTVVPYVAASNTLCLLLSEYESLDDYATVCTFLTGNFGSLIFDFVARCKLHGNHMNWFILEQLPCVPIERYNTIKFGSKSAGEVVRDIVLELIYTSHALGAFAAALNYVDKDNQVYPPFSWNPVRRRMLRAKLDAVYFHLYGITDPANIDHIHAFFRVEEEAELARFGDLQSKTLRHYWLNALAAGQPDAEITTHG